MSILARMRRWVADLGLRPGPPPGLIETPLDRLSNSVVDAIEAGDYEAAERRCQRLLREYPDVFDGHERLAMLREAQGRYREAAKHYSKVLAMMRKNPQDTDPEAVRSVTEQRDQAFARARERR